MNLMRKTVLRPAALVASFAVFLLCSCTNMSCSHNQADVNAVDWCHELLAECARGFPPAVVVKAKTSMKRCIYNAWEWRDDWLSKRVFTFENGEWEQWVFLQTDAGCAQTSCPSGIPFVNEILAEYPFAKADVANDAKVHAFLDLLRKLYSRDMCIVGSREFLRIQEKSGHLPGWLEAKEQNEAVLRRLFRRPTFEFKGKLWKVSFNAFNIDGSVDEWTVRGRCRTRKQCNEVQEVSVRRLKGKGTFSFPWPDWAKQVPDAHWGSIIAKQPADLVAKAREVLEGRLSNVWEWRDRKDWLSNRIFKFSDEYGFEAIFLETDGDYVQLNCPSGIAGINQIFTKYTFEKHHFADPEEVGAFLGMLVSYYRGPRRIVGSSIFLEDFASGEYLDGWLMGSEPSEEVFKSLCKDPHFIFAGSKWEVMFNVFKPGGSVDRWKVTGEYDAGTRSNKILSIDVGVLKPEGTFSYPLMG